MSQHNTIKIYFLDYTFKNNRSILLTRKILLFVLFFLVLQNDIYSQNYWIRNPSPTNIILSEVYFLNNNTGWIAGDSGTVFRTTNQGLNWTRQSTYVDNYIVSIFFIDANSGWALSWDVYPDSGSYLGTIMLRTTNGGDNWNRSMFPDSNRFLKSIYFLDQLTGFTGGTPGGVFKSVNGGVNWVLTDIDTASTFILPIENFKFFDTQTGYACGGFRDLAGCMWKTTNGGNLWKISIVGPEPLNDLHINNISNVIAVGGDFEYGSSIVRTTNSGLGWNYEVLGIFGVATSLDFRTESEAWIAVGQNFVYSLDSGNSWRTIFTPDSVRIEDLCFTDTSHGWAVGYDGSILKYYNPHSDISVNNQSKFPEDFILYQNYPNPFNPKTIIRYQLAFRSNVSLKVYDALGKEVAALINEKQNAGEYKVEFDARINEQGIELPSGVYFYELKTGESVKTKAMILLK